MVNDQIIQLWKNKLNNSPQKYLNWKTPYEVFGFMMSTSENPNRGKEILDLLNIKEIKRDEVTLKPYLIKHNKNK